MECLHVLSCSFHLRKGSECSLLLTQLRRNFIGCKLKPVIQKNRYFDAYSVHFKTSHIVFLTLTILILKANLDKVVCDSQSH